MKRHYDVKTKFILYKASMLADLDSSKMFLHFSSKNCRKKIEIKAILVV